MAAAIVPEPVLVVYWPMDACVGLHAETCTFAATRRINENLLFVSEIFIGPQCSSSDCIPSKANDPPLRHVRCLAHESTLDGASARKGECIVDEELFSLNFGGVPVAFWQRLNRNESLPHKPIQLLVVFYARTSANSPLKMHAAPIDGLSTAMKCAIRRHFGGVRSSTTRNHVMQLLEMVSKKSTESLFYDTKKQINAAAAATCTPTKKTLQAPCNSQKKGLFAAHNLRYVSLIECLGISAEFVQRATALENHVTHSRLLLNLLLKCRQFHAAKRVLFGVESGDRTQLNTVLLLLVDALLGCAVFWILAERFIAVHMLFLRVKTHVTVASYEQLIVWLMGWPAGFKLNRNLNRFFGEMFLWMLGLWATLVHAALPNDAACVFLAMATGFVGFSTLCAVLADAVLLLTLHLHFMCFVSARILRFMTFSLVALCQLFRGQKWNSLRQRYDFAHYNTGQLLAGTLLCTVLAFLFPTVLVYWLAFWVSVRAVGAVRGALGVAERAVLHFPFFECVVRLRRIIRTFCGSSGCGEGSGDDKEAITSVDACETVAFVQASEAAAIPRHVVDALPSHRTNAYYVVVRRAQPAKKLVQAYVEACVNGGQRASMHTATTAAVSL